MTKKKYIRGDDGCKERQEQKEEKEKKKRREKREKNPVPQAYIRELSPISEEKQERELPQRWCSKSQALRRSCHVGWIDQQACYF